MKVFICPILSMLTLLKWFAVLFGAENRDFVNNYVPELRPCYMDDFEFMKCLKEQMKVIFTLFEDGNVTLRVPPLNPFYIHYLPLPISRAFNCELSKIYIHNFTRGSIKKFWINFAENKLKLEFFFDNLHLNAEYRIVGNVFGTDLRTAGPVEIDLTYLTCEITLPYELVHNVNRATYYSDIKLSLASMNFSWKSFFQSDLGLLFTINEYIQSHWSDIVKKYKDRVMVPLKNAVLPVIDRIIIRVPVNKMLKLKDPLARSTSNKSWVWFSF